MTVVLLESLFAEEEGRDLGGQGACCPRTQDVVGSRSRG